MGKTLADLQSNISISAQNAVTGTLLWVDDYTGFSSDPAEQSGNYIALKISASSLGEELEGATITATYHGRTVELDSDQIIIVRQAEGEDSITFTANKEGYSEGRLTLDFSGLTLTEEPFKFLIHSNDPNVIIDEDAEYLPSGSAIEMTGQVPWSSARNQNDVSITVNTKQVIVGEWEGASVRVYYDAISPVVLYNGSMNTDPPGTIGTLSFTLPITAAAITDGTIYFEIQQLDDQDQTINTYTIEADIDALTLQPIPQTLTITIPENAEDIGYVLSKSDITVLSRNLFRRVSPGMTDKVGTLTDVDSKTKRLSSSRSLYNMNAIAPLNSAAADQNHMSGVIVPIKITRLDSTYTAKFKKGASGTEKPIAFNSNDIGYVLTGPSWANDWPYYINVYNSSNELIDTYTIEKTGNFNTSTAFTYTPIANLYSNGADLYYRTDALPSGTDIVPGIEDASGNPVPVSTFQENLVIPSSGFAGQFTSGTIHYVQGLKYSDTQAALADGYYLILNVPQYTGSDAQYLSRIRYGTASQWEAGCNIYNPSSSNTPAITKPISMGQSTITRRIENHIYQPCVPDDASGQIFGKDQQPNLTFDPIPT